MTKGPLILQGILLQRQRCDTKLLVWAKELWDRLLAWYLPRTIIDFVGCVKSNYMLLRMERETESVRNSEKPFACG